MPLAILLPLIAQIGEPLALGFLKMWEADPAATITAADYLALKAKYGSKSAADYLAEAQAAAKTV